jgi:hypothetical protein
LIKIFELYIRIGSATRDDALKKSMRENFPGPGNYNHKSDAHGNTPSYKFGNQIRDKRITSSTPGPGQYHIPYTMMDVPRYLTGGSGFSEQMRYI